MRGAVLGIALVVAVQAQPVPPLTGRVVDLADVLSPSTEATLTSLLAAHEDSTSNQVAVLTIPSLEGAVLEPYATRVFREWGLGQAETVNGVLLLVAVGDREVRIEVGYGLEGDLTDATSGTIIRREIVPRFRDGDFDAGVLAGTEAVLLAVDGAYEPQSGGATLNGEPLSSAASEERVLFGVLFTVFPLVVALFLLGLVSTSTAREALGVGLVGSFLGLFVAVGVGIALLSVWAAVVAFVAVPLVLVVLTRWRSLNPLAALDRWVEDHPMWGPKRRHARAKRAAFTEARTRGDKTVVVDGRSYRVPVASSGGSGGGSSSSSGGGFSGGGGSSGGGGASGSW